MNYTLPKGLTSEDIFFWVLELAQDKFKNAAVYIAGEDFGPQQISQNLDASMYECFCPFEESFDVYMECSNGDRLSYEAIEPEVLHVDGLSVFESTVKQLPPPQSRDELFYGDFRSKFNFRISQNFYRQSVGDQLRHCMNVAVQNGAKLYVSAKENRGHATQVLSRSVLTGYEELIDIVMRLDSEKWILIHVITGMVYTSGFDFSAAEKLLGNIVND